MAAKWPERRYRLKEQSDLKNSFFDRKVWTAGVSWALPTVNKETAP